jgi:tetraacyldisaccharide 4'-kinase
VAELLFPLGVFYYLGQLLRAKFTTPESFSVPILCIGNFTAGGTGKTPTAVEIARLLSPHFTSLAFVSRGYGGKEKGPLKVDPARHTARQVGDEPLLLAQHHACYIARRRGKAIRLAIQEGAKLVIMDDGMQNPTIRKNLSLAVVDGGYGFGNSYIIPSGPLREPVAKGLERAAAILFIGQDLMLIKDTLPPDFPLFDGQIEPTVESLPRSNYLAFAGIGRPDKFFQSLVGHGIYLRHTMPFPDHHRYTDSDIRRLKKAAQEFGADTFITTEKDMLRLPAEFAKEVLTFPIAIRFKESATLTEFILTRLKAR